MKASRTIIYSLFIAITFCMIAISGCDKDDNTNNNNNNGEDWATPLIGTYTHETDFSGTPVITTITVNRKDNKKISLKLYRAGISGWVSRLDLCMDSVELTSQYHCVYDEYDSCYTASYEETIYGKGTADFTTNSIEVDWDVIRTDWNDTIEVNILAIK